VTHYGAGPQAASIVCADDDKIGLWYYRASVAATAVIVERTDDECLSWIDAITIADPGAQPWLVGVPEFARLVCLYRAGDPPELRQRVSEIETSVWGDEVIIWSAGDPVRPRGFFHPGLSLMYYFWLDNDDGKIKLIRSPDFGADVTHYLEYDVGTATVIPNEVATGVPLDAEFDVLLVADNLFSVIVLYQGAAGIVQRRSIDHGQTWEDWP
jgi:hypothetical protein